MPPSLIDSQFAALEPPAPDEQALYLDAAGDPTSLVDRALAAVRGSLSPATPPPA
jgi:gluconate kinase